MNPNLKYESFDKRAEFIKNVYDEYTKLAESSPAEAETLKMTKLLGLFLGSNKDEIRETDEYFIEDVILSNIEGDELEQVVMPYLNVEDDADPLDELLDEARKPALDLKKLVKDVASKVVDEEGTINDSLVDEHYKKLYVKYRSGARQKREDRINADLRSEPIEYLKDVTLRVQELADKIPLLVRDSNFDAPKFKYQATKTSKAISSLQAALLRAFED